MNKLENVKLFLLDMDGTLNFENTLIDGAEQFIKTIINKGKQFYYLTNNSALGAYDYYLKMTRLGLPASIDNIFTSGMAMGLFLQEQRPNKKVYLIGTKALAEELKKFGVTLVEDNPDIVVVGYDRELTYHKLELACQFITKGAEFLATHCDVVYPVRKGLYYPDCGSFCQMLTLSTKKEPTYLGKPSRKMIDILSQKLGIPNEQIAMVGDRIYTDVATAVNANAVSVLVLSGETTQEDLDKSKIKPDIVVPSVKELIDLI